MQPEVLAALRRHRAEVTRLLELIGDEVLATWVRAWSDIEAELLEEWPESRMEQRRRLEQAKRMAGARITSAAETTGASLTTRARAMIERGLQEQSELIAAQTPLQVHASILRPPGVEVDTMVARVQERITATTRALSHEATQAMNRALVLGVAKGENPRETARRMVTQARGGFDGGLRRAQVIARTEMIDAHRNAAQAGQDANRDVLAGWEWFAQLGPRTCPSCVVQHGQLHDLDEPGPLDHQQGRCARVPVTKTWRELGFDIDEPPRPRTQTGQEWFEQQPESVQRSILGPKRYDAWKAGAFPPEEWSVRKSADGWRDSFHVGAPPKDWKPKPVPGPTGGLPLPRLDGVEAREQTFTSVNPKLNTARSYQVNCANVVQAAELRIRGYDVTAGRKLRDKTMDDAVEAWRRPDGSHPTLHRAKGVGKQWLNTGGGDDLPNGSRGMIGAGWRGGGGHVWSWEKVDGKIIFREGQRADGPNPQTYLGSVQARTVLWFRVDDADFVGDLDEWLEYKK